MSRLLFSRGVCVGVGDRVLLDRQSLCRLAWVSRRRSGVRAAL